MNRYSKAGLEMAVFTAATFTLPYELILHLLNILKSRYIALFQL